MAAYFGGRWDDEEKESGLMAGCGRPGTASNEAREASIEGIL